jgi:hypothetical protein
MKRLGLAIVFGFIAGIATAADDFPFMIIRFRAPQTDGGPIWRETVEMLKKHKPACDEVWFSTGIGYPPMKWHAEQSARLAAAAKDMRALGIEPSLQFQATMGHGDLISALDDCSAKNWGGFTGADGRECKLCSCPRQPGFLAYMSAMGRIYGVWRPGSVWIDDDLRIDNHQPNMKPCCWCDRCVGDFAKEEGKPWTRATLSAACAKAPALRAKWERFNFKSIAEVARVITRAIHAVSPETRMGYQHCLREDDSQLLVYKAMAEESGHKVRSRPGGGAYFDHSPYEQITKSYFLARQMKSLGMPDYIDQCCPEIETAPRSFTCRTGQGLAVETLLHLAQGMNSVSYLIIDSHLETPAWYGDNLLARLAAEVGLFRDYVKWNEGTRPGGVTIENQTPPVFFATMGVPLCPGMAFPAATMLTGESVPLLSDDKIRAILAGGVLLDGRAAESLVKRGFANDLGGLKVSHAPASVREHFTDDPLNAGLIRGQHSGDNAFTVEAAGARVLGRYVNWKGEAVGDATLLVPTAKGGRAAVFGCNGFDGKAISSNRIRQFHRAADWASGGKMPVVLEDAAQCVLVPRVTKDGALRSVMALNTTIDRQQPVRLRLRGVDPARTTAEWHALGEKPVSLPVDRDGADAFVTLPVLAPWNAGWLSM